ncbi:MAG: hypothetical protein ACMUIL_10655 [bacterium]
MDKDCYDDMITRCPLLGGEVPFRYCRKVDGGSPCRRAPVCWSEHFDIAEYIRRFCAAHEIDRFLSGPGPGRLGQIMENLERVKRMEAEKNIQNTRDELIEEIRTQAPEGKITCAKAWSLADRFHYSKRDMGRLLDELKIKLTDCQLGCF